MHILYIIEADLSSGSINIVIKLFKHFRIELLLALFYFKRDLL